MASSTSTAMATGPMLLIMSARAELPWVRDWTEDGTGDDAAGAAPLSVWKTKRRAAVRIGVHLTLSKLSDGKSPSKLSIGCALKGSGCVGGALERAFMLCCARIVMAKALTWHGAGHRFGSKRNA